jgi:carboxypeptidase C (cathepsin A)
LGLGPETADRARTADAATDADDYFPPSYVPCAEEYMMTYFNRADVQKAIHAELKGGAKQWQMCNNEINQGYNRTDTNAPMMPVYKQLLGIEGGAEWPSAEAKERASALRVLIYSGDDDSVCATLGTQQFIWDLGLDPDPDFSWRPWKVAGEVAGYKVQFKGNRLTFATVHGAGHMVPATRPEQALALFKRFLQRANGW